MHEVQNWVGGVTIFLIYDPAPKTTNQTSFYFFFFFFFFTSAGFLSFKWKSVRQPRTRRTTGSDPSYDAVLH